MNRVSLFSLLLLLFGTILLVGCSRNLNYDSSEVKSISFYSLSEDGNEWQIIKVISDEVGIKDFLNQLANISYTKYSADIKAKSDFYIRITFINETYENIDQYRILRYDKDNNLIKNLKFKCSSDSFKTLFNSFTKE